MTGWKDAICHGSDSVRSVLELIDRAGTRLGLVIDENGVLIGTISDGDIRRALLAGRSIEDSVVTVMNHAPIVANIDDPLVLLHARTRSAGIEYLPLLDGQGKLISVFRESKTDVRDSEYRLVVMAGGRGTRLHPLTLQRPKPLIEVGGKPIIDTIIEFAVLQGIRKVIVSIGYLGSQIEEHLGDGSSLGVEVSYLREDLPLGTAGALSLLDKRDTTPFLVMNGDVLSRIDLHALIKGHEKSGCPITVVSRPYEVTIPYGVIHEREGRLVSMVEKPTIKHSVNTGIYACSHSVLSHCSKGVHKDMPNLIAEIAAAGHGVNVFESDAYWLDIGRLEELERANREWNGNHGIG